MDRVWSRRRWTQTRPSVPSEQPSVTGDPAPRARLEFVDALRGLAAVYVVLFHVMLIPDPILDTGSPFVEKVARFGGTGVFLFFVISGFSLAMTMPRHLKSSRPSTSYAISRLGRIAPLFYALLIYYYVSVQLANGNNPGVLAAALSLTFLFNFFPGQQAGVVIASWTIGVEMIFYALFPLLYGRAKSVLLGVAAAFLVLFEAVIVPLAPDLYAYFTFVGYMALFVLGMLAWDVFQRLRQHERKTAIGRWLIVGGLTLLVVCALPHIAEKNVHLRLPIGIGYAALLIGCGLIEIPALTNRVTAFYGRISYSVYLLHPLVVLGSIPMFRRLYDALPAPAAYLVSAGMTLGIVTALAALTFRFIERPGIELAKRTIAKLPRVGG